MEDLLQVGVITSPHGVRGEVKVYPTTDDVKRFKKLKTVLLDLGKEKKELHVSSVKFFKNMVILKFDEFSNMDQVEPLRKKNLYVTRENAVKLSKDEYFIADLIDMDVVTEDGTYLGKIKDVLQTGANDVYAVETKTREVLIPAIKDCIIDVDMDENIMKVHLLPGLMEES